MTANAGVDIPNPTFGDRTNQLSVHPGVSIRDGFETLVIFGLTYSQPNKFFRLHGRQNMEFIAQYGFGDYSRYNQRLIFGLSQDAIMLFFRRIYAGINLGIYIKPRTTDRIGSQFTFGERVFTGMRINDDAALELYGRHFSNGKLTPINGGQNFVGVSTMWNF